MDCILKRDVAYFYSWKSLVFLCTVDGLRDIWELRLCAHSQMPIPKSYSYRKAMTSMLPRNTGFSPLHKFCVYLSFLIILPKSPGVNGKADSPVTSKKCQLQMHQATQCVWAGSARRVPAVVPCSTGTVAVLGQPAFSASPVWSWSLGFSSFTQLQIQFRFE